MPKRSGKRSGKRAAARAAAPATGGGGGRRVAGQLSPIQAPRQLSQRLLRIGGSITPVEVSAIMREADTGYMYRLCDLMEESRNKDCTLGGILYRREESLSSLPWQIVPTSDRPKALRIAAWVDKVLRSMGGSLPDGTDLAGLSGIMARLNGAILHGYAAVEVVWKREGQYLVPQGGLGIGARRFIYSQYDGSLRWWDAVGPLTPYPGVDLRQAYPAGRMLVHRPRMNGAEGPREGLIRPLLWAAIFRNWSLQDWLKLGELAWKPYRWAEYAREYLHSATQEDLTSLDEILEKLVSDGYARVPDTVKLHFEYAKGTGEQGANHAMLCAYLAAEMAKLVLGATLTVEAGKTGAMALGNVHADVAKAIRDMDARAGEGLIKRQLIAPLVSMNFGAGTPVPDFEFLTEEGSNLDLLSAAVTRLLGKDGTWIDVGQAWIRQEMGIPEPLPGEKLLGDNRFMHLPSEGDPPPSPLDVLNTHDPIEDGPGDGPADVVSKAAMDRALKIYRFRKLRTFVGQVQAQHAMHISA